MPVAAGIFSKQINQNEYCTLRDQLLPLMAPPLNPPFEENFPKSSYSARTPQLLLTL